MDIQREFENFEACMEGHETAYSFFESGAKAALEYARGNQEPVAWINYSPTDGSKWYSDMQENIDSEPLYTAPTAQPVQPAVSTEQLLGAVARGWCHERNKHKVMDTDLAYAIAEQVEKLFQSPAPAVAQEPVEGVVLSSDGPSLVKRGTERDYIARNGGSLLYTHPDPAVAVNEQMLSAIRKAEDAMTWEIGGEPCGLEDALVQVRAAIAAAEAAKGAGL